MSRKILIVDDEAHIRALIEQTLEDLEDSGAVALIAAERPELVFLDVMMPRMNGYDVCRTVREELRLPHVRIVLLTAKGQEADRLRGEEVGADRYATKPFDPDELYALAREWVLGTGP